MQKLLREPLRAIFFLPLIKLSLTFDCDCWRRYVADLNDRYGRKPPFEPDNVTRYLYGQISTITL
jgi:hypothetical protein